jgi:Transglutaminase-like superfamily
LGWRRYGAAIGLLLLLGAAVSWLREAASPVLGMAGSLAGTRWYRVDLADQRIGNYRSVVARRSGRVVFASRLDATLPGGEPFGVSQQLEFDAAAPQPLLRAQYVSGSGPRTRRVSIVRAGSRYRAEVDTAGVRETRALTWQYTLAEHLALELWLHRDQPPAGVERRVPSLDFEHLEPVARTYRVVERRSDGYAVARAAPLDEQIVLFDAELIPQALSLAGLFTLTLAPAAARDEPNRSRSHANYTRVELATEIPRATEVRRLTLEVNHATAAALAPRPGLAFATEHGRWLLVSDPARAADTEAAPTAHGDSVARGLAADDPRLAELLARAAAIDSIDPLAALTRFVHGYLRYDDASHSLGLADTLLSRRGDCTEFADLLTALARLAGYQARTVTGLAYSNDGGPAFMLHAWTEVFEDGGWRGLDPTWNEAHLDAAHLPFPDSDVGYLRAYTALPHLRFKVRSIEY